MFYLVVIILAHPHTRLYKMKVILWEELAINPSPVFLFPWL